MNTKIKYFILIFMIIFALISGCSSNEKESKSNGGDGGSQPPEEINVSMAGGTSTGSIGQLVEAMSAVITKKEPSLNVSSVTSGGAVDDIELLRKGEIDTGYSASPFVYKAYNGIEEYENVGEFKDLRLLFTCYSAVPSFAVRAQSDIESVYDLVGKTVSIGPKGAGLDQLADVALKSGYEIADDMKIINMAWGDGSTAVSDGKIDSQLVYMAGPVAGSFLVELDTKSDIRYLPWDIDEILPKIKDTHPWYAMTSTFQGSNLPNEQEDFEALALYTAIWTTKDLPEEVGYKIVKTVYDNQDEIIKYHNLGKALTLENALNVAELGVPVHKGAAKYFKEEGVWDSKYKTD